MASPARDRLAAVGPPLAGELASPALHCGGAAAGTSLAGTRAVRPSVLGSGGDRGGRCRGPGPRPQGAGGAGPAAGSLPVHRSRLLDGSLMMRVGAVLEPARRTPCARWPCPVLWTSFLQPGRAPRVHFRLLASSGAGYAWMSDARARSDAEALDDARLRGARTPWGRRRAEAELEVLAGRLHVGLGASVRGCRSESAGSRVERRRLEDLREDAMELRAEALTSLAGTPLRPRSWRQWRRRDRSGSGSSGTRSRAVPVGPAGRCARRPAMRPHGAARRARRRPVARAAAAGE